VQFLIETDVLREYLIAPKGEETVLRKALSSGVCYTTMYNALELFRACSSKEETDAVLQMLMVVRVLGFNSRFGQSFAEIAGEIEKESGIILTHREAMIIGMAKASKLTIMTKEFFERYTSVKTASVVHSAEEVPS
jgi:predicted nucleic acid-binding protein